VGIVAQESVGTRNLYSLSPGGLAPLRDRPVLRLRGWVLTTPTSRRTDDASVARGLLQLDISSWSVRMSS